MAVTRKLALIEEYRRRVAVAGPYEVVTLPVGLSLEDLPPLGTVLCFRRLHPSAREPLASAAGYGLHAFLRTSEGRESYAVIPPRNIRTIHTGLTLHVPGGYSLHLPVQLVVPDPPIFPISFSTAADNEAVVTLYNGGFDTYRVRHGDRIGRVVLLPLNVLPLLEEEPSK